MNTVTIKVKTLTPIWTGDAKQECTEIKPQTILGGLRTLYQEILQPVLVKKDVYKNCAKTNSNGNALEICKHDNNINDICPVCRVFGCTGYKARFSLRVSGGEPGPKLDNVKAFQKYYYCEGKNGIVSSDDKPIYITLSTPFSSEELDIPLGLICLCAKYMAIGAKNQWGYGAFEIATILDGDDNELSPDECIAKLKHHLNHIFNESWSGAILDEYVFGTLDFGAKPPRELSGTCDGNDCNRWTLQKTKTALRSKFVMPAGARSHAKCSNCNDLRHALLGTTQNKARWASQVNVTRLHKKCKDYRMHFWAKVPQNLPLCSAHFADRNAIVSTIESHFASIKSFTMSHGITL